MLRVLVQELLRSQKQKPVFLTQTGLKISWTISKVIILLPSTSCADAKQSSTTLQTSVVRNLHFNEYQLGFLYRLVLASSQSKHKDKHT